MKVCDKTCIFFFFPIINKYFLMAKRSLLSRCPSLKRLAKMGRNKSVGPDGVPGEVLKLDGENMTPYLVRLLEISLNSATIPREGKIATVVRIYKGGDRSAVSNYRKQA